MHRISIIHLVVCLMLMSGCNFCCWGKPQSEKNCPTDIRQTHCWCFGEDAIFHHPCGPKQEFYGYQPTCWREWPASGAAWRDAYCQPVVTTAAPGTLESQAPGGEGPVILPGGELPEPFPITPPTPEPPMLPPQEPAIEGNMNPTLDELMPPPSNEPATFRDSEAARGAETPPGTEAMPRDDAPPDGGAEPDSGSASGAGAPPGAEARPNFGLAPGALVTFGIGATPNAGGSLGPEAVPNSGVAPGAEAQANLELAPRTLVTFGAGATPSAGGSTGAEVVPSGGVALGAEVPAPVQFGLPTSSQLTEPQELPVSEENDEQPLKDSWWQTEGQELQQSVHVSSGDTVQPAYYRAESKPRGIDAGQRTKPELRRLPPI